MEWRFVLFVCAVTSATPAVDTTTTAELAKMVVTLQEQVVQLRREHAQNRATIRALQEKLDKRDTVWVEAGSGVGDPTSKTGDLMQRLESEMAEMRQTWSARQDGETAAVAGEVRDLRHVSAGIRADVQRLRRELDSLRARREEEMAAVRASQAATPWMKETVDRLRSEIAELAAALNLSLALRQRQRFEASLALVRKDLATLRGDLDQLRAEQRRDGSAVGQLRQEVGELRNVTRKLAGSYQELTGQVEKQQHDVEEKPVKTKETPLLIEEGSGDDLFQTLFYTTADISGHPLRHHKQLKAEVSQLKNNILRLERHQEATEQDIVQLTMVNHSLNVTVGSLELGAGKMNSKMQVLEDNQEMVAKQLDDVRQRVKGVEKTAGHTSKRLDNVTESLSWLDKVHTSTVQLFEALETLEAKFGQSIGDLQKEMSKMEFNAAQMQSSLEIARHDQARNYDSLKLLKKDLVSLQAGTQRDHHRLNALQGELLNISLIHCRRNGAESRLEIKLSGLELRLVQMEKRASQGVGQLTSLRQDLKKKADTSSILRWETNYKILTQSLETLTSDLDSVQHQGRQLGTELFKFVRRLPVDCSMDSVVTPPVDYRSGVYLIRPHNMSQAVEAFCDMDTDNGHWTVIQRREDGSEDFYRDWTDYRLGFGDRQGEFWLGNEALHALTGAANYSLRIDMWDTLGHYRFAVYDSFRVAAESDLYRLEVSGYHGNASDALKHHTQMSFSTRDADHDSSSTHCAMYYSGGWWYNHCQYANLNGRFGLGLTWFSSLDRSWIQLNRVEMKIRPT